MAILLNEDYEHFMVQHPESDMNEAGLRKQVDIYFQGQVSTVFFCVNAQRAYYDSHVYEPAWQGIERHSDGKWYHRGEEIPDKPLPTRTNTLNARRLHDVTGGRAFQIRIDQCRKHGGTGGLSIRMNDCHLPEYINSPMHSDLWFDHPEWRLGAEESCGLDLGVAEVRAKILNLTEEVFQLFDMDVLELDWMRSPPFFRDGHEEENMHFADELVQTVSEQRKKAEKRLGHPIRLAVRVPSRPDEALKLGLDPVLWAKKGWVDLVIPCAYIFSTDSDMPLCIWRKLLPVSVQLVPGMDIVSMAHRGSRGIEDRSKTLELLYGYSAVFFYRGADDVYLFNHMDPEKKGKILQNYTQMMHHIGKRETVEHEARRHICTMCMNLVPGIPWHSALPLTVITFWQKIRIEVGGALKGRRLSLCFAFETGEDFNPFEMEFMADGVNCPVTGSDYPYELPNPEWKKVVCSIPENVVPDGSAVFAFRSMKTVQAVLHWCEMSVEAEKRDA